MVEACLHYKVYHHVITVSLLLGHNVFMYIVCGKCIRWDTVYSSDVGTINDGGVVLREVVETDNGDHTAWWRALSSAG